MLQASPSAQSCHVPRCPTVWLALIFAGVLGRGVAAQVPPPKPSRASLGGLVVDARSTRPLVGATVILVMAGPEDAREELETETDPEGRFLLSELAPGEHLIRIRFDGRAALPQRIQLPEGHHTEIRVSISLVDADRIRTVPVAGLPPLEVRIEGEARPGKLREFYERSETAPGHFISGPEIRERAPFRTSDLMREVPGLIVTRDPGGRHGLRVTRSARCPVEFYLDGTPAPGLSIDDIPPGDIGGLEIYRGASEVPVKYRRATSCAAILIWTRDPGEP